MGDGLIPISFGDVLLSCNYDVLIPDPAKDVSGILVL